MYKKSDVEAEVLTTILEVFTHDEAKIDKWTGEFLLSLTKADNFDMTLMMADDTDKKLINDIVKKLSSVDTTLSN